MSIDKYQVQRQFNRSAAQYDDLAMMQRQIVDTLMAELPKSLNAGIIDSSVDYGVSGNNDRENSDGLVICDAGCGTGYALMQLSNIYPGANLTGLDIAPAMLQAAEQRLKAGENKALRVDLLQGDIESLPFSPDSLNLCFSSSAVQWCDVAVVAKQMYAALRPGGSVLISSFLSGTLQSWRQLWDKNDQRFLTLAEFDRAISDSGLVLDRLWTESFVQSFDTFHGALKSVRNLGAGNASAARPKGLMSRARFNDIRAQADAIIQRNGAIELSYQVVYAKAFKPKVFKPKVFKAKVFKAKPSKAGVSKSGAFKLRSANE
ncbi:MAG: malonyl-CoA O-methyltransferase [Arenicella sp.]|jgi:malonyl-CoA O-methyltransferase